MKCPDCDRKRVETMEEFWKNPSYSCPADVPRTECNDQDWLELYCAQGKVARLEAALAEEKLKTEAALALADEMRASERRVFDQCNAALAERDRRIAELQGERDRFRLQVEQ